MKKRERTYRSHLGLIVYAEMRTKRFAQLTCQTRNSRSQIRTSLPARVMHLVHVWCDYYQPQQAIDVKIQSDVGMLQFCVEAREDQVDNDDPEGNSKRYDCC
jgi:hypothetical protein